MKVLLDNCVHKKATTFFAGHKVRTAAQMGWAALSNGALLAQAASQFDAMIATDKNLRYQHDLSSLPLTVIELHALDTRWPALERLAPCIGHALALVVSHRFIAVHPDGQVERLSAR